MKIRVIGVIMAAVSTALITACAGVNTAREPLELEGTLGKAKYVSKFEEPDKYVWGASPIKGDDGKYHLFYSRWNKDQYHYAWVVSSEIAHAVSDTPFGPWKFSDVALPKRDKAKYWDGSCTHNPVIKKFDGKYYLYYMGNIGDEKICEDPTKLNWLHRNNQRIGVAVSDSPYGPWKRFDKPLIDVSSDENAPDAICTTNPSITKMKDGRYLLIYKAVGKKRPGPSYGPVVHLAAVSDRPDGGFVKNLTPIFTCKGSDFPAEDPYIWYRENDGYYAIVKDCHGAFCPGHKGESILALFRSDDGFNWAPAIKPFVTGAKVIWEDGNVQILQHYERPQVLFDDDGEPMGLFCACDISRDGSFNVSVPIDLKK